jgi:hypothetical protein
LNNRYIELGHPTSFNNCHLTAQQIASIENLKLSDVIDYHELLVDRSHVHCKFENNIHNIMLLKDGRTALVEKNYLKEGRKNFSDSMHDNIKWITPLIAVIISLMALGISACALYLSLPNR